MIIETRQVTGVGTNMSTAGESLIQVSFGGSGIFLPAEASGRVSSGDTLKIAYSADRRVWPGIVAKVTGPEGTIHHRRSEELRKMYPRRPRG